MVDMPTFWNEQYIPHAKLLYFDKEYRKWTADLYSRKGEDLYELWIKTLKPLQCIFSQMP